MTLSTIGEGYWEGYGEGYGGCSMFYEEGEGRSFLLSTSFYTPFTTTRKLTMAQSIWVPLTGDRLASNYLRFCVK